MIVREELPQEKSLFDEQVGHPLQSWAWGNFKQESGAQVVRLGAYEGRKLLSGYQFTIHKVPYLNYRIGYFPKGDTPDDSQMFAVRTVAERNNLVFVKIEPNVYVPAAGPKDKLKSARDYLTKSGCVAGRPMFTPYSFVLDLKPSHEELFARLKQKTRYNIRLAQKNGVKVKIDNSDEAFDEYIQLWKETTKRQGFYAHTENYHRTMWQHLREEGVAYLIKAVYNEKTLSTWIVFMFNKVLYYPYGASSREHREVMASNLLAWEAMCFGKDHGCTTFDMWGSLGPNPDQSDPWYGFHKFKEGYGGDLVEFVGTYDYVHDASKYKLLTKLDNWRWKMLKLRTRLPF